MDISYLKNFSFLDVYNNLPDRYRFDTELAQKAYEYQVSIDIRYNIKTGKTYNNNLGNIASYVNSSDMTEYRDTLDIDILINQFMPNINNSISRIKRGLNP